jgi:hypothetical protein
MFASWRLERLERDFNLDCLVFGLMPCNFHKRRHRNDAKVKHSASLINKCLWTWEPSKKGSKNQTGYFKTDIIRYWCTVHTYTNYIYICAYMYILLIICVCANLSLSLYVKFQFVSCGRLHPLSSPRKTVARSQWNQLGSPRSRLGYL